MGPSAIEMPTTAPQKPNALARSTRPTKICEMIDSATGFSMDPPMPWMSLAPIRVWMSGHAAQQRAGREDRQADLEHPAAAEPVAGGTESISSDASTRV